MAARIRMKKMGRTHRPFYRICVMDARSPRDGKAIEEIGFYDPFIPNTDARVRLDLERVKYWLSVGAQPTPKVGVLIRKYGPDGTHLEQQAAALEKLNMPKVVPPAPKPVDLEAKTEQSAEGEGEEGASAEGGETAEGAEGEASGAQGGESSGQGESSSSGDN